MPVNGLYGIVTIGAELINIRDVAGSLVNEQWLFDRERTTFMELLDRPKTQECITWA